MNVFHRSNLALAIFDIVDLEGNRSAEVWAFNQPDLIELAMHSEYDSMDIFAPPPTNHYGRLTIEGRNPHGIHVTNADDLADAMRRHWGRFTEQTAIDDRGEIGRR